MKLIRKSLLRRLFVKMFIFALALGGLALYLYEYGSEGSVTPFIFVTFLGGFFALFMIFYYFDIIHPMRGLLNEIQNLLTGRPYKKVYTPRVDEIGVMAYFFNQVTKSLGKISFNLKDRERMLDELSVASQLQRDILPLESPHIKGLTVVAKNRPATELGGDSFNIFTVGDKNYIYVGDVTGHGVSAGLIMTMVNSFVSVFSTIHHTAYDILVAVNSNVKKYVKRTMFMTVVMLCWDSEKNVMSYVGAGHEHILVYRGFSGQCEVILSGGVALGMVADNSKLISEHKIDFDRGDFIVLYSDGITEARNDMGEMYTLDRLVNAVKQYAGEYSADGLNYHIAQEVSQFMGGHEQDDDMTLIVIARDTEEGSSLGATSTAWE